MFRRNDKCIFRRRSNVSQTDDEALHATGLTTKYRRFTLVFGGCLIYGLGLLLIVAPETLTF